jgi:hypothetical protein
VATAALPAWRSSRPGWEIVAQVSGAILASATPQQAVLRKSSMLPICRRFASLDRGDQCAVVEAAVWMLFAVAGLRFLRFLRLRRIFDRCIALSTTRRSRAAHPGAVPSVSWAIRVVSARLRSATCLAHALAADAMLRRRGVASQLRFGIAVRPAADAAIAAHAWVECDGGLTIGAAGHQPPLAVLTAMRSR